MTQLVTTTDKNKDEGIRQYHRKRLFELSLRSIAKSTELEEPTEEQKQWIERRMRSK